MRQIHVCAWLLMTSAAAVACSGEKFTPAEVTAASDGAPALGSGGSASQGSKAGNTSAGTSPTTTGPGGGGAAMDAPSPGNQGGSSSAAGSSVTPTVPATGGTGSAPSNCGLGEVKFKMLPGKDLAHDYLCDAACGTGWLSITDAEGATAYSLFSSCGTASCETCEVQSCVASACQPKPLTGEGNELSWDGSYFTKDTCGANMACQKPACVKPGRYKAKACAAINTGSSTNGSCVPKEQVLCAEAEVELPATKTVELFLQP